MVVYVKILRFVWVHGVGIRVTTSYDGFLQKICDMLNKKGNCQVK